MKDSVNPKRKTSRKRRRYQIGYLYIKNKGRGVESLIRSDTNSKEKDGTSDC